MARRPKQGSSVSLLLLNGGIGRRVGTPEPKQLLKVRGIPILVYSLIAAEQVEDIKEIVLNYPAGWKEQVAQLIDDYAITTPVKLVPAGETRHQSVAAMLPEATFEDVLIHEAARPLVHGADLARLISFPGRNVSYMLPIPFTVAPVDPEARVVTGSLDRDRLRNVQLPQKFSKSDLMSAHARAHQENQIFTEDATLLAQFGFTVSFIDGNEENFKVTTPTDVRLAAFLMQENEADDS